MICIFYCLSYAEFAHILSVQNYINLLYVALREIKKIYFCSSINFYLLYDILQSKTTVSESTFCALFA